MSDGAQAKERSIDEIHRARREEIERLISLAKEQEELGDAMSGNAEGAARHYTLASNLRLRAVFLVDPHLAGMEEDL